MLTAIGVCFPLINILYVVVTCVKWIPRFLEYARYNGYVVFTHDLDFGTILAATKADCPSVIQVRAQDVTPEHLGLLALSALRQFEKHLKDGAIVTVDQKKLRARILPLHA